MQKLDEEKADILHEVEEMRRALLETDDKVAEKTDNLTREVAETNNRSLDRELKVVTECRGMLRGHDQRIHNCEMLTAEYLAKSTALKKRLDCIFYVSPK